ncbi:MAG: hypothetical protein J6P19_02555 [Acetobacter sp.]|nr:hypothetical protein [Acetobacter sp.]
MGISFLLRLVFCLQEQKGGMRGIFPLRAKRAHSLNSSSRRRRGILRKLNAADQAAFSVLTKLNLKN